MSLKNITNNQSLIMPVVFGVVTGLGVQLLACAVTAYCVTAGSVTKSNAAMILEIARLFGVGVATIITWLVGNEKRLLCCCTVTGILIMVPIVLALLFWEIDLKSMVIGMIGSGAVFGVVAWLLNRSKRAGGRFNFKKHYR